MSGTEIITRRDFLRTAGVAFTAAVLPKGIFPLAERLSQAFTEENFPELLPVEERKGIVVARNLPVRLYPVRNDYFYDFWKDANHKIPATVEELRLNNVTLGYLNRFYATDTNRNTIRYAVLPHVTGNKSIALAQLDEGYIDSRGIYHIERQNYSSDLEYRNSGNETGIEHTILAEFYPNKIRNILEACRALDDFQQEQGGFTKNREYSMLEILNLQGRDAYVTGLNSARQHVNGGGVCIVATNMCKLQRLLGSEITERWMHPVGKYNSSPFAGWLLRAENSDATVQDGGEDRVFDLKWIQARSGFIEITAAVIPNGKKVISDFGDADSGGSNADALITVTSRWTDRNPGVQSARLEELKQAYIHGVREKRINQQPDAIGNSIYIGETAWAEGDHQNSFLETIAPEERVSRFADELISDPVISSISDLRTLVNNYPSAGVPLGDYLRSDPWYTRQVARLGQNKAGLDELDAALRHLNYNTNLAPGEPMQCVGLAVLLAGLNFGNCRFRNIGGATRESDNMPISCAADLVPNSIRDGTRTSVTRDKYTIRTVTGLDEILPGDLFVLYNTGVGHIGGVIGKKHVGRETVLLFTAANQTRSGDVKIFEVDGNNFDVVMGPPPYNKVIIR